MSSGKKRSGTASRDVVRFHSFADLRCWAAAWNELAEAVPFRRWEWLDGWWRHYGLVGDQPRRGKELYVLAVIDRGNSLLAVAPWYLESSATAGRVLRFLGDGEVCSEYPAIMAQRGQEAAMARLLADWLVQQGVDPINRWDTLFLSGMEPGDTTVERLLDELALRDHAVERRRGPNCWRLRLPQSWGQYLAMLSKCHRKQLRRLDRDYFRSGRAVVHWVHQLDELPGTLALLIDLHQRRWGARGKPGCFGSRRFVEFHHEVAARLLSRDMLRMSRLELDGRPIAVEYHFAGLRTVYAYQSGVDPECLAHQPGRLSNMAAIRRAIERGDEWFDFLRGDEPYKAHWRAEPLATVASAVVPARLSSRLRFGIASAGNHLTALMKSGWRFAEGLVAG